jgi:tRNA nucleotidyltransferase (CCA-adding enzyme)
MAFDPVGRAFVDPFGGERDLAARTVRCVRDPMERFGEDGLRPLRAVRFATVLEFGIEPATEAAIGKTLDTFEKVARERIREELVKILLARQAGRGLALLQQTGLLARALPEAAALGAALPTAGKRLEAAPAELETRLAALLFDLPPASVATALEKLRLPNKSSERAALLVAEKAYGQAEHQDDAALRRALSRFGKANAPALLSLARAQAEALADSALAARADEVARRTDAVLAAHPPLSAGELALGGAQIMKALAAPPGPAIGQAQRFLLSKVIEDPSLNTESRLLQLLAGFPPGRT